MRKSLVIIALVLLGVTIVRIGAIVGTRVTIIPAPLPPPRAMIDCRNFPVAASCAAGVADLAGETLGKAIFCDQPEPLIARLRDALQVALPVISQPTEPYLESTWLARDAERRAYSRARFRVLPTDCEKAAQDLRSLLREFGVRSVLLDR